MSCDSEWLLGARCRADGNPSKRDMPGLTQAQRKEKRAQDVRTALQPC